MHAFLVAAAEHAETSKTAFYVAGIALAGWAVLLSAIGLSRPEFPGSAAASRGVIAISAALVIAAAAAAVATG
jgi:hypothetical protein